MKRQRYYLDYRNLSRDTGYKMISIYSRDISELGRLMLDQKVTSTCR
jgi:hypothetical protein